MKKSVYSMCLLLFCVATGYAQGIIEPPNFPGPPPPGTVFWRAISLAPAHNALTQACHFTAAGKVPFIYSYSADMSAMSTDPASTTIMTITNNATPGNVLSGTPIWYHVLAVRPPYQVSDHVLSNISNVTSLDGNGGQDICIQFQTNGGGFQSVQMLGMDQ